jgi:hypothetical protein
MDRRQSNQSNRQSRASLITLIVLAFLLLVAALVLVLLLPDDENWRLTSSTAAPAADLPGIVCAATEAQGLYPLADGVIRLTGSRIAYLDIRGTERFVVDIDFAAPFAVQRGDYLLAADRDGHDYVLLSPEGAVFSGSLGGLVCGAAIGPDGQVALIQDQQGSTGVVTVLEAGSGRHLFDCLFPQSGYVLSVAFPDTGGIFDVLLVNTDGATIQPIIKRFRSSGEAIGQLLPDSGRLYPGLLHDAAGNPVLVGANQLIALSYQQDSLLWQQAYHQVAAVAAGSTGLFVLAGDRADGLLGASLVDSAGKRTDLLEVGDSVAVPDVLGDQIAFASGSRVLVVDSRKNRLIWDQNLSADVVRLQFVDQDNLTVVTNNGVYAVRCRD